MKTAKGGRKHRSAVSFCCDSSFAAPRGGRDANPPADYDVNPISTRAPRTGRDKRAHLIELGVYLFQSSRPIRGATDYAQTAKGRPLFQSTRPVRGATVNVKLIMAVILISILAPRAGRDCNASAKKDLLKNFNPRAPHGARLPAAYPYRLPRFISIRAPRTGRDAQGPGLVSGILISIRAPRTGRDTWGDTPPLRWAVFQSARPARGATTSPGATWRSSTIFQSARPARGATKRPLYSDGETYFNPRAPHGARRKVCGKHIKIGAISIRAPRTGRDAWYFY